MLKTTIQLIIRGAIIIIVGAGDPDCLNSFGLTVPAHAAKSGLSRAPSRARSHDGHGRSFCDPGRWL